MALNKFTLPQGCIDLDINKIENTSLETLTNELKRIFNKNYKSFKNNKGEPLKKQTPDFINFKKYCIIQYIKYADFYYKTDFDNVDENMNTDLLSEKAPDYKNIHSELTRFLNKIISIKELRPDTRAIQNDLDYLKDTLYITCKEKKIKKEIVTCYTCDETINNAFKYMVASYSSDVFETKEFCIQLNTTKKETVKNMKEAIKTEYNDNIILIEYCPPEKKKNGYNHVKAYLRIVARKDSSIFDDLSQRKHTNQEKGKKKK